MHVAIPRSLARRMPLFMGALMVLCLAACATRPVTPVSMSQAGDLELGCADLSAQLKANEAQAAEFLHAHGETEKSNATKQAVIPAAVFLALPIAILMSASTDYSAADQVQARALIDRNERLGYLAQQRGCKTP